MNPVQKNIKGDDELRMSLLLQSTRKRWDLDVHNSHDSSQTSKIWWNLLSSLDMDSNKVINQERRREETTNDVFSIVSDLHFDRKEGKYQVSLTRI